MSNQELFHVVKESEKIFPPKEQKKMAPEQALALSLDLDLSTRKYQILRSSVNSIEKGCVPSSHTLNALRKSYIPKNTTVTEISGEVDLQEILNKTANSILKLSDFSNVTQNHIQTKLICKWGFDGSSGLSPFKQNFGNHNSNNYESIFFIAFSPIRLLYNRQIIWKNPRPSSTRFCRPIKFVFKKETPELVREEEREMKQKISLPYEEFRDNKCITVSYEMLLTMLDGSIGNILSETNATARCFICGAGPREMNTSAILQKPFDDSNLRFGLSTLHCWIVFLSVSFISDIGCQLLRGKLKGLQINES